ncbi:MAG: alpha-amylase [Bacteroidales bacterium]|uniref:alpha-amylase family glycosyl hydrolase n=1 Tax=Bacteroides acidifaciens TaxID=85831 RepID=UPI000D7AA977|nr:alpha-amylase family glycosyl hydrolase [Bacteroides acidifaciens]PWL58659.1 MAG: alpha-amylase [Bacteroidales bacterium]
MNKIASFIATVAAFAAAGCTSYEIDMPANPAEPVIGNEVSTNVIYQANPRFFGDNECLKGLTRQVSRIAGMECDILWVMPVYEPGELNGIGSPYCIRDFKAVNPRYGTMTDLKELVNTAHSSGMKVILDWVANHTAWDCSWITEHPDWYVKDAAGNIVSPSGWSDVAQLNFANADMRAAMKDAMLFWVEQLGIDGYRCDYADGVPHDFWSDVITALRAKNSDMIMLAETANPDYYADGFDMIYDWNSSTTISAAFNGGKPADVVKEAVEALAKVPDGKSILRYVFNHDVAAENNVATMFGAPEGVPAAYMLASMLNGTPMIYSSMDVEGLSGKLSFFNYMTLDFSTSISDEYKAINAAFKASTEVRRGELRDFSNSSVVCFTRAIPGHNLLVAVNTTGSEKSVKSPISLAGSTMTGLIDGKQVTVPVEISLEPYSYTILMN